eukprot:1152426-Pelagomonas_calceolata.AAC.1
MPIPSSTLINILAPDVLLRRLLNSRHQDQARATARDTQCLGPRYYLNDVGSVFTACEILAISVSLLAVEGTHGSFKPNERSCT